MRFHRDGRRDAVRAQEGVGGGGEEARGKRKLRGGQERRGVTGWEGSCDAGRPMIAP